MEVLGYIALMTIPASLFMYLNCGSPLNWWSPYFGHDITANKRKIGEREQSGESSHSIQNEIEAWVKNCAKGRWVKINPYRYRFFRKGDAAFFKLAWG